MIVKRIEDKVMARIEEETHVFEVNFDKLKVKDVVLVFKRDEERIGSIYNDDGTERTMARLETKGEEDFISVEVEKEFIEKILEEAGAQDMIEVQETSLEAYKTRIGL